ncbi:hypothetical protein [Arthrobacter oryzae]|uniref:hypothetical protein n=1 Tax=Arthrobacter oryzae TaxID=409290 RepID=UPI0027863B5C|nr:hypothetical protein [Arthrobacter oryzae]MDQ0078227.1 hypothetical protein [Arthrobacter oryzae]
MSTPEQPAPQKSGLSRNKILIIIGGAVILLLAIIAIAVSSQAIRASEEAAAKEKAVVEASKMAEIAKAGEEALADLKAADAKEANGVCERRLVQKYPTATVDASKTKSVFRASDGSYDTTGAFTDKPAGNTIPRQFVCSSIKGSGTSWTVYLKPLK